ncbi:hypothetical protein EDB81DRAFT_810713 [Dactylonectria macrodidyma]|uniref:Uncharacterized protein n=1 Tax=Dactylonectria macrodidyma TaxID=307937 RepID=A0A9P9IJI2_9HYPO|nr:hypothetical protein EDB81DRAFT_810713 [Dactylonectria macrodidyma]
MAHSALMFSQILVRTTSGNIEGWLPLPDSCRITSVSGIINVRVQASRNFRLSGPSRVGPRLCNETDSSHTKSKLLESTFSPFLPPSTLLRSHLRSFGPP